MGVDRKSVSALLRLSYKQRLIRFPVQFIKVLVADPSCNTDAYGRFQGSPLAEYIFRAASQICSAFRAITS